MNVIPIQVTDEGVLIPKSYLHAAGEFELVVMGEYILIKPKASSPPPTETPAAPAIVSKRRRYSFIASGQTRNPKASAEAEKLLESAVHRRSGWSVD
jgi:hypothetical protein